MHGGTLVPHQEQSSGVGWSGCARGSLKIVLRCRGWTSMPRWAMEKVVVSCRTCSPSPIEAWVAGLVSSKWTPSNRCHDLLYLEIDFRLEQCARAKSQRVISAMWWVTSIRLFNAKYCQSASSSLGIDTNELHVKIFELSAIFYTHLTIAVFTWVPRASKQEDVWNQFTAKNHRDY